MHARPDPSLQLASTYSSVWPGLNILFVGFKYLPVVNTQSQKNSVPSAFNSVRCLGSPVVDNFLAGVKSLRVE